MRQTPGFEGVSAIMVPQRMIHLLIRASLMGGGVPSQSTRDNTGPTTREKVIKITSAPHRSARSAPSADGTDASQHRRLPQRAGRPIAAVACRLGRREQRRFGVQTARVGEICDVGERDKFGLSGEPAHVLHRDTRCLGR
jgi:hypothetical protein